MIINLSWSFIILLIKLIIYLLGLNDELDDLVAFTQRLL
jgi:hypothetical protein